jgi:hypothetical protein
MLCLSYYCLCLLVNKIGEEAEQVLPGSEGVRVEGGAEGGRGEKWPKQCMNI